MWRDGCPGLTKGIYPLSLPQARASLAVAESLQAHERAAGDTIPAHTSPPPVVMDVHVNTGTDKGGAGLAARYRLKSMLNQQVDNVTTRVLELCAGNEACFIAETLEASCVRIPDLLCTLISPMKPAQKLVPSPSYALLDVRTFHTTASTSASANESCHALR